MLALITSVSFKLLLVIFSVALAAVCTCIIYWGRAVIRAMNDEEAREDAHTQALEALGNHPMGLRSLQARAHTMAVEKGWYDGPAPEPGVRLMLMVTELAEAFEEIRNGHRVDEVYYNAPGLSLRGNGTYAPAGAPVAKPEGVPVELADVIIRILDFCGANDIDLEAAVYEKMAYNGTRPYRHGGKAA